MKPVLVFRSPPSPINKATGSVTRYVLSKEAAAKGATSARLSGHKHRCSGNIVRSVAVKVPPATCIKSLDCPITKIRRGIVNKVSPEKLDDLTEKMLATFNVHARQEVLMKDIQEFLILVFAAASRQPQYVSVFTEFMRRICSQMLDSSLVEEVLVNQAQTHWSSVCLSTVEKSKGWELMSPDDQLDAKGRHRAQQLAIAELCGLLASSGLIPPSYPISWTEALIRPIQTSCFQSNKFVQTSSLESAMEIICCTIRGLGLCEASHTFTDIDQSRFSLVFDSLMDLPTTSSRSKCMLKDLCDLRNSAWTKSPDWKQALVPHKRVLM